MEATKQKRPRITTRELIASSDFKRVITNLDNNVNRAIIEVKKDWRTNEYL